MRVSRLSLGSADCCPPVLPLRRARSLLVPLPSAPRAEAVAGSVFSAVAGGLPGVVPPENAAAEGGPRCAVAAFLAALSAAARRDASSASSWLLARSCAAGDIPAGASFGRSRNLLFTRRSSWSIKSVTNVLGTHASVTRLPQREISDGCAAAVHLVITKHRGWCLKHFADSAVERRTESQVLCC